MLVYSFQDPENLTISLHLHFSPNFSHLDLSKLVQLKRMFQRPDHLPLQHHREKDLTWHVKYWEVTV